MTSIVLLLLVPLAMVTSIVLGRAKPLIGLVLSPFLSAAVTFCVVVAITGGYDFEAVIPLVFGCMAGGLNLILTLLAVVTAKAPPDGSDLAYAWSRVLLIILASVVAVALAFGIVGPGLGIFSCVFMGGLLIRLMLISRDAWTTQLFTTMGSAIRQSLPLPEALAVEAVGMRGKPGRIFRSISYRLAQGLPLSEALRMGYRACPGYALAMITAAEKIHQLPQAFASIEAALRQRMHDRNKLMPANPMYPLVVLGFVSFVLLVVGVFILPSFRAIFRDMGDELPWVTTWVFDTMPLAGMIVAPSFLLIAGLWFYTLFRPRKPADPHLLSIVGDTFKWLMPGSYWFERTYAILQTVSFLRMSLTAGTTVDQAIAEAASLDTNVCYQRRLRKWLRRVQAGQSISQAAADSGVGKSIVWAFDQQANPGRTLAVLEMLESSYRAAYSANANLFRLIFWPCITIGMGLLVACVVLALFLPWINMIRSVMGNSM